LRDRRIKVLYPSYFDIRLSRSKGRRVPKQLAVKNPNLDELIKAASPLGEVLVEREKARPSRWYRREGRILIKYEGSKEDLLKKVGQNLRRLRVNK